MKKRQIYNQKKSIFFGNSTNVYNTLVARCRAIIAISICVLVTIIFDAHTMLAVKRDFDDIIAKLYYSISVPLYWAGNKVNEITIYLNAIENNELLIKENIRLKQALNQNDLILRENKSLRALLHYQENLTTKTIAARVVSTSVDSLGVRFMINIGSIAGVKEGQAVINEYGLVGRIVNVSNHSARVLLITDAISKIPAKLLETDISCIVQGISQTGLLKLLYLPNHHELIIGEKVVTSGEGTNLPYGLYIGEIISINNQFFVKPDINTSKLGLVSVILLDPQENTQ